MKNWTELDESLYDQVWDKVYKDFRFNPSVHEEEWPSFIPPSQFITFDISKLYGSEFDELMKDLEHCIIKSFKEITHKDEFIYALDWHHTAYWYNPHFENPSDEFGRWPVSIHPDGDYYFYIKQDFSWGYLGHPWEHSVCLYGEKLLLAVERNMPKLFKKIIRQSI